MGKDRRDRKVEGRNLGKKKEIQENNKKRERRKQSKPGR